MAIRSHLLASWDLEEVEKKRKEKIVADNGLVDKLAVPVPV